MRVRFEKEDKVVKVDIDSVPRPGEYVDIEGSMNGTVRTVMWWRPKNGKFEAVVILDVR